MAPSIRFFDAYPFARFREELIRLSAGAHRCEAAIAFVTNGGCDLIRSICGSNATQFDLVTSVRFPTDLPAIIRLSERDDVDVHLHLGYDEMPEPKADRGQFHSKLATFFFPSGKRLVLLGSHNWTANALDGYNLEASVVIECTEDDEFAKETHLHFLNCKGRSFPVDPRRLLFYQTIQNKLHRNIRSPEAEPIPGFDSCSAVVIHAEYDAGRFDAKWERIYIPIREVGDDFFPMDRRVMLFLHSPGTLFKKNVVAGRLRVLSGQVTMANRVSDSPVTGRAADAQIDDLLRPVLRPLPGNVPVVTDERRQVIVQIDKFDDQPLPVFHSDEARPRLKPGELLWVRRNRDEILEPDIDGELRHLSEIKQSDKYSEDGGPSVGAEERKHKHVTVRQPQEVEMRLELTVPALWMHEEPLKRRFQSLLHSRRLIPTEESLKVVLKDPSSQEVLGDYVYNVNWLLTNESLSRAGSQIDLDF